MDVPYVNRGPTATRTELAGTILRTLEVLQCSHFRYIFTGDESWIFYSHARTHQWVASMDDLEEMEPESHFNEKQMLTVFFNITDEWIMTIMPKG
jgi:hypothetical protein